MSAASASASTLPLSTISSHSLRHSCLSLAFRYSTFASEASGLDASFPHSATHRSRRLNTPLLLLLMSSRGVAWRV